MFGVRELGRSARQRHDKFGTYFLESRGVMYVYDAAFNRQKKDRSRDLFVGADEPFILVGPIGTVDSRLA